MADSRGTHTAGPSVRSKSCRNTESHILVSDHFEFGGHVGGHFVRKISQGWSQYREDAVCKKKPRRNAENHIFSAATLVAIL